MENLKRVLLFEAIESSLHSRQGSYRKKKRDNLIVIQDLRRQQLLILAALEENTLNRSLWKLNRYSFFWEEICAVDDHHFKAHFRMTHSSFEKLCGFLGILRKADTNWRTAISLQKRVAIALFTLGSAAEYRVVSELFGVGKSTVCAIFLEFCEEVWQALSTRYIKKLPPTQETVDEYVDGFHSLGFPQCLGAIDGCHIEVRPNASDTTDYFNYKGWYSIVLLALVDYRYRFIYINIGAPGRCNDSQIYNSSLLKKVLIEDEVLAANKKNISGVQMPICILGDSAFKFSTTLMKPYAFSTDLSEEKKLYNYMLSKCRRVAENAFGHVKARFRRIGKGIDNEIGNAPSIVQAACVLHNFLNEENDTINQMWLENLREYDRNREYPTHSVVIGDNEPSAENIRQALCRYFGSNVAFEVDGPGDGENGDGGVDDDGVGDPADISEIDDFESIDDSVLE
ncbi:uncharacterized protein [Eurosta solidaginis]|uniref:uncharacterized protein n=1 Tax=Eurosta solidaginis TaxID=178769 RepID=UPI00353132F9